ncbi:MAG: MFS transporter [Proteobacteria bacterium]|nr:MFS transporter [Pseudomonadota bacterium]MBU1451499.1 MFS transporter [Pseudomonadota bacterium]MBU2470466.1 MFS transporter [Pseudomonadota bacterium]MBU2519027.1 MFS transporter [Pseudomonadota bacterium]
MDAKALALLILGHLVTDTTQGALPALLPLLKQVHTLSYAQAGVLVMVMNLTSSVIQPLFGDLTDRWNLRWLVPMGVAVSGLGFGLIGLCSGYAAMLGVVVLSGLGVASFHPEAFKGVLGSAGSRKVVGVSWFMVGGNAGMALGPVMIMAYCAWLGLKGSLLFGLPGVVVAGLFWAYWRHLARKNGNQAKPAPQAPERLPLRGRLRPLGILMGAVILRAWVHVGVATFVPFYYVSVLGGDAVAVGSLLTTFLAAGVVGTLAGAPLAEKVGPKRFFVVSVAVVSPLLVWLQMLPAGPWLYVVLALTGGILLSTWSVVIVMGQQILPDRAGTVSGMLVGFAMGLGGVGAALMGMVADHWGVSAVLRIVTVLPLLSALVAVFIPAGNRDYAGTARA